MVELRGAGDEPEDGDASLRRFEAGAGSDTGDDRLRHEPRPRAEYADVMRQNTGRPNTGQSETARVDADPVDTAQEDSDPAEVNLLEEDDDAPDTGHEDMGQGDADHADSHLSDGDQAETDQSTEGSISEALERFDPRRAGLPEVSHADAAAYIEEHIADRPWLALARDCSPNAQRVFVALDQGHGHAHIRHEGWVTEELNERRVRKLEDPAQLDPELREVGVDAFKAGGKLHWCGSIATRITNPEIFAEAFARGVELPDVRAALDSKDPDPPGPVSVSISDVLGPDGHKFCSGSQLEPVDESMKKARTNRDAWVVGDHSGPEPRVRPVETFEGGTVTFTFRPSPLGGYEVNTMYVNPHSEKP